MSKKRTPDSLFNEIAQDNEVLQRFKHHSLRVMYLSSMLAKKVDCYDEDLYIASLLHDIGKIGLSKEILFKTEKLTGLEWTILQSHSHVGNLIVRKELGKTQAAEFIRDHHENWDGSGYPRGLVGEEISTQGRIIRICDSFDAMTYDMRDYKLTKMSYKEAFDELERCSWKDFDGNLVQDFISLLIEIELPDSWYDKFDSNFIENLFKNIEKPTDFL